MSLSDVTSSILRSLCNPGVVEPWRGWDREGRRSLAIGHHGNGLLCVFAREPTVRNSLEDPSRHGRAVRKIVAEVVCVPEVDVLWQSHRFHSSPRDPGGFEADGPTVAVAYKSAGLHGDHAMRSTVKLTVIGVLSVWNR